MNDSRLAAPEVITNCDHHAKMQFSPANLEFDERVKGDHFIFSKNGVSEIINLQPLGNKAKAYQVKQVRNLIVKYKLAR